MSKIKVGDRIRIYSNADIWTGLVEKIYPNGRLDYICISRGLSMGAHIKQCRKLVKKAPREWWVNTKYYQYEVLFGERTGMLCRTTKPYNTDGWICLREVRKK